MRGQHDGAGQVRGTQRGVRGGFERKVRKPVVDEVDRSVRVAQHAVAERELGWCDDGRVDPMAAKQVGEEEKLRIQELRLRVFVDDSDARGPAGAPRGAPLGLEHLDEMSLELGGRERAVLEGRDIVAAGALRPAQDGVEHRAAGIGVDLDEPRTLRSQMKVVPHEYARSCGVVARNWGRPGEHRLAVRGKRGDLFDGAYDLRHLVHMSARDEYRQCREKVRAALGN